MITEEMQVVVLIFGVILAIQTATFFLLIRGYYKIHNAIEALSEAIKPKNVLRKVQK